MGREQGVRFLLKKTAKKRKRDAKIDESEDDEEETATGSDGKKMKTSFDADNFISQLKTDVILLADGGKKYIENKKRRTDTFSQRKKTLLNVMKELHAQTKCAITFSITSPSGRVTQFSTVEHRTIGTQYEKNPSKKKRKSCAPKKLTIVKPDVQV